MFSVGSWKPAEDRKTHIDVDSNLTPRRDPVLLVLPDLLRGHRLTAASRVSRDGGGRSSAHQRQSAALLRLPGAIVPASDRIPGSAQWNCGRSIDVRSRRSQI